LPGGQSVRETSFVAARTPNVKSTKHIAILDLSRQQKRKKKKHPIHEAPNDTENSGPFGGDGMIERITRQRG